MTCVHQINISKGKLQNNQFLLTQCTWIFIPRLDVITQQSVYGFGIIENYDILHRGKWGITDAAYRKLKKNGEEPQLIIDKLLQEILQDDSDWTRIEKINNQFELSSDVQEDLLYPVELMKRLESKKIQSALTMEEGKGIAWFCIMNDIKVKKTKNNKDFMTVSVADNEGNLKRLKIWGYIDEKELPYTLWIADMTMQKDWGLSTNASKMKKLTAFD